jgi:hypothetical protein
LGEALGVPGTRAGSIVKVGEVTMLEVRPFRSVHEKLRVPEPVATGIQSLML